MRVTEQDLRDAANSGILSTEQVDSLLIFMRERRSSEVPINEASVRSRFDLQHLLWYAGGGMMLWALAWFTNLAFLQMGGTILTVFSVIYASAALAAGRYFWKQGLRTPGGLLIAIAASMAPVFIIGLQYVYEAWPGKAQSISAFLATDPGWNFLPMLFWIAALSTALRACRFPFLLALLMAALWFSAMELTALFLHPLQRPLISLCFGIAVFITAWWYDVRKPQSGYAFWLHLTALLAIWCTMTLEEEFGGIESLTYVALNIAILGGGLFFRQPIYAMFGAVGVTAYLAFLANAYWKDTLFFPAAMSLIGFGILLAGIAYHRHRRTIETRLERIFPRWLSRLRPDRS